MNNGGEETSQKSKLPYLPDDVIIGILLRSPARSVGRFRCLSKLFCSLLSDPKFARKQLQLSLGSNAVRSNNRKLIIMYWQKLFLVDFESVIDVEREYSLKDDFNFLHELTPNPRFKGWDIAIVGSSNGLVCARCTNILKEELLLYNPTTRESKRIPDLPRSLLCKPHHKRTYSHNYGFGFDALNTDYEVMELVYNEDKKFTLCYVYSLKTNSWRRMPNILPYYMAVSVEVSREILNGAIHWIARIEGGESQRVLMAFDIEKEEFREMSFPNWTEEFDFGNPFTVDTLKGCLCLVHCFFKMHNVIWVMEEYGVESSWSKIRISISEYSIKPLWLTDEELLLIPLDGHFVLQKLKIHSEETYYDKFDAHTYVESLISLKSSGEHR